VRLRVSTGSLGYDRSGHGVPLVLCHAFPLDRRMWSAALVELRSDAELVTVDLCGLGESEGGHSAPSIEGAADDVAALLDGLGLDRAVVGGVSMGGYVALAMAARHPDRLRGLVLADTRAAADTPEQRAARDAAIARIAAEGTRAYIAELVPRLVAPSSLAARQMALALGGLQSTSAVAGALAALRDRPDRTPTLAAIAVPTTVIVGSEDTVTPPEEARRLAAAIPGATLVELTGVGHLSPLEAPAEFAAALRSLLARV
jgi:3-oxoadipate enol-lactonase